MDADSLTERPDIISEAYFQERRDRGDLADFDAWLAASPDQAPDAGDEWP